MICYMGFVSIGVCASFFLEEGEISNLFIGYIQMYSWVTMGLHGAHYVFLLRLLENLDVFLSGLTGIKVSDWADLTLF